MSYLSCLIKVANPNFKVGRDPATIWGKRKTMDWRRQPVTGYSLVGYRKPPSPKPAPAGRPIKYPFRENVYASIMNRKNGPNSKSFMMSTQPLNEKSPAEGYPLQEDERMV